MKRLFSLKNFSIREMESVSITEFSSLSDPCTAFSPTDVAKSFLIVPSAASGLVEPRSVLKSLTALSFSKTAPQLVHLS